MSTEGKCVRAVLKKRGHDDRWDCCTDACALAIQLERKVPIYEVESQKWQRLFWPCGECGWTLFFFLPLLFSPLLPILLTAFRTVEWTFNDCRRRRLHCRFEGGGLTSYDVCCRRPKVRLLKGACPRLHSSAWEPVGRRESARWPVDSLHCSCFSRWAHILSASECIGRQEEKALCRSELGDRQL